MAKMSSACSFQNAVIDMKDFTITEYEKDVTNVYNLLDVLKQWDGIEGVTLTIKQTKPIAPMSNGGETD